MRSCAYPIQQTTPSNVCYTCGNFTVASTNLSPPCRSYTECTSTPALIKWTYSIPGPDIINAPDELKWHMLNRGNPIDFASLHCCNLSPVPPCIANYFHPAPTLQFKISKVLASQRCLLFTTRHCDSLTAQEIDNPCLSFSRLRPTLEDQTVLELFVYRPFPFFSIHRC